MNIKIDKLQSLHILTDVVDHNELAELQGGSTEVRFPRAAHYPMGLDATAQYEPTRPYREYMEFTIDSNYHDILIDRCEITVNREDESNYRFTEIGLVPRLSQSATILIPLSEPEAILTLSNSVHFGEHSETYREFDIVIRRYDQAGFLIITIHFRGCRITSIETYYNSPAKFIIEPQAIFYV